MQIELFAKKKKIMCFQNQFFMLLNNPFNFRVRRKLKWNTTYK